MRRTDLPTGPHSLLHQLHGSQIRGAELVHCLPESRNSLTVSDCAWFTAVILYSILFTVWHIRDPHVSKADATPETSFKCMPQWTNVGQIPIYRRYLLTAICGAISRVPVNRYTVKVYPRRGHEGPEGKYRYSSTLSVTSALDGDGWSTRPGRLIPGKRPGIKSIGGWMDPRAGMDGCGKSRPYLDSMPGPSSPWRHYTDYTTPAQSKYYTNTLPIQTFTDAK